MGIVVRWLTDNAALSWARRPSSCSGLLPSLGTSWVPGAAWESGLCSCGFPPSPVQKKKGALVLGGTHVPRVQMGGGSSPHPHAAPRSMWSRQQSLGHVAGTGHGQRRVACGCIFPGCLAAWETGLWRHPMCCHPSFRPQSSVGIRTEQEKESHAGSYHLSSLCATLPGRGAQLNTWMNPCPWHIWDTVLLQIHVLEKLEKH